MFYSWLSLPCTCWEPEIVTVIVSHLLVSATRFRHGRGVQTQRQSLHPCQNAQIVCQWVCVKPWGVERNCLNSQQWGMRYWINENCYSCRIKEQCLEDLQHLFFVIFPKQKFWNMGLHTRRWRNAWTWRQNCILNQKKIQSVELARWKLNLPFLISVKLLKCKTTKGHPCVK